MADYHWPGSVIEIISRIILRIIFIPVLWFSIRSIYWKFKIIGKEIIMNSVVCFSIRIIKIIFQLKHAVRRSRTSVAYMQQKASVVRRQGNPVLFFKALYFLFCFTGVKLIFMLWWTEYFKIFIHFFEDFNFLFYFIDIKIHNVIPLSHFLYFFRNYSIYFI